ncbi:MAG: peptidylprolyl isomerase [Coriobacteriales bacterium]
MKKLVTIIASAALAACLCIGLSACGGTSQQQDGTSQQQQQQEEEQPAYIDSVDEADPYASGTHHVKVKVEGYKAFAIALDADSAPITVSNFCALVEDGFYNGLTFHRAVEEFCLQGGDPNGDGTGGSEQEIKGEFSGNGVANKLADSFKRGTVAMARNSVSMNSATSQFFITLGDVYSGSLNGQYAAFGSISKKDMATVDKIVASCIKSADPSSGIISAKKQPVIKSITVVD